MTLHDVVPLTGTPRAHRSFHYSWIVVGVTFFTLLITAGVRSTPGVLMIPLEQEFGWTRAMISVAVSVSILLYGLMGPFAAAVMDTLGVRRTNAGRRRRGADLAGGLSSCVHHFWRLMSDCRRAGPTHRPALCPSHSSRGEPATGGGVTEGTSVTLSEAASADLFDVIHKSHGCPPSVSVVSYN